MTGALFSVDGVVVVCWVVETVEVTFVSDVTDVCMVGVDVSVSVCSVVSVCVATRLIENVMNRQMKRKQRIP